MRTFRSAFAAAQAAALLGGLGVLAETSPAPLDTRLDAEFRLPVYLNRKEAVLTFERRDAGAPLSVEVSFSEQGSGYVPAAPVAVALTGAQQRHDQAVDLSGWPDGHYRVLIREKGRPEAAPLVRAVIKQTLSEPEPFRGDVDLCGLRMLFADGWYLARSDGVARRVCPAEMIPLEPWKTRPDFDFPRNTIKTFLFDVNGDLNVRISASRKPGGTSTRYWARSRDLKTWEIIDAPLPPHPDSAITDLEALSLDAPRLARGQSCRRYDPSVDGKPDLAQVRVYFTGTERGEVKWGDVSVAPRSTVAVWEKTPSLRLVLGEPITTLGADPRGTPKPGEIGDWTKANDNFGDARLSADGRTLRFWQTRRVPRYEPFRVQYDNLHFDRVLTTWSSGDGLAWTPTAFSPPTPEDPWGTQHYDMCTWREEGQRLELAYYQVFNAQRQQMSTELASSRDGILWQRVEQGRPFLGNGAHGAWNFGFSRHTGNRKRLCFRDYCYEAMQGVNVLHFMFLLAVDREDRSGITAASFAAPLGGRLQGEHGISRSPIMAEYGSWDKIAEATRAERSTPGLMRYRRDRWVGLSTTNATGIVVTKTLRAPGAELAINAATRTGGQILVEVLDAAGKPLGGYCGENAAVFAGDETGAPLRWSGGKQARLPDEPFALSIRLRDAEVFALAFGEPVQPQAAKENR